ncbi:MAG: hypothetical protein ACOYMR_09870 [Ilumatobacteraceae bacterium]
MTGVQRSTPRRVASIVLACVMALSLAASLTALWAHSTLFDADGLAKRSVHVLDSPAVRHEVAVQLTDQLVQSGNRQVIAFRPAAQLTVETLVETDAFKSIFASALRKFHASLLSGDGSGGLDLSDSLGLLSAGLQLNQANAASADGAASSGKSFGNSMGDTMQKVADLSVWEWKDTLGYAALGLLVLAIATAIGSVYVAANRRRGVVRVGVAAIVSGVLVLVIVVQAARIARGAASEPGLQAAIEDAVWRVTDDLRASALAIAVLGAVVAAAASPTERFSPEHLREAAAHRYEQLRGSARGTIILSLLLGFVGLWIVNYPGAAVSMATFMVGLGFVFTATRLLVSLAAQRTTAGAEWHRGRWVGWAASVLVVLLVAGSFSAVSIGRARARAEASYTRTCLGREDWCDLRLDQVTLAGSHNAMSSAVYPGWLFGEQIEAIGGQLNRGVRALLIDAHYGRRSSVKVPGAGVNLVVTDIASEFAVPGAEVPDAAVRQRAQELAAKAPNKGAGRKQVYLCHNYCELGAVPMVDEMKAVRRFLESSPGEIVVIVVQDAVSSADIVKVIEDAGLRDHVATLRKGEPLPTLGQLVDDNTRLVMFAERGDADSPDWYPHAYDWFQETKYTWTSLTGFDCAPNRGTEGNPLFLVNHWVNRSPPDPAVARKANSRSVLDQRLQQCLEARGLTPNVVATDFATTGDVVALAKDLTGSG